MAQEKSTKREKFLFYNTLGGLLKALEKKDILIDLRDDSSVSGFLKHVDGFMNVDMENVVYFDTRGNQRCFENFFVHARNIRYVHVPKGLNATSLMQNYYASCGRKREPKSKKSFKQLRAEKYQKQIIQDNLASTSK